MNVKSVINYSDDFLSLFTDNSLVSKNYVDAVAAGLDLKQSVRVATTTALPSNTASGSGVGKTLTATANGALVVDGVSLVAGNRILVKNEATASDNGIYVVTNPGSPTEPYVLTRATDADGSPSGEVTAGMFCYVEEGTVNGVSQYVLVTPNPIVVDSTSLTFTQYGQVGPLTFSEGLLKTGTNVTLGGSITNNAIILGNSIGGLYFGNEFSHSLRLSNTEIHNKNVFKVTTTDLVTTSTIGRLRLESNSSGSYVVISSNSIDSNSDPIRGELTLTSRSSDTNHGVSLTLSNTTNPDISGYYCYYNGQVVSDSSTDNRLIIRDDIGSKGLVYYSNYEANFTGNSLVTKNYVDALSFADTITGDGSSLTFTVTHNLNSYDVIVQVIDITATDRPQVLVDNFRNTINSVVISFATPPPVTKSYRVLCYKTV